MKLNLTISLLALATLSAAAPAVQLPVGLDLDKDPNDKKVNVSLYVMSKCPDAVRATLPLQLRLVKSEGNVLTEKTPNDRDYAKTYSVKFSEPNPYSPRSLFLFITSVPSIPLYLWEST